MAYISRRATRKQASLSAEFMYLLVVLAAGVVTAWWAAHKLGADLSAITTIASVLGINETIGHTRPVGYSRSATVDQTAPVAAFCNAGQSPIFAHGLADLKLRVGDAMGSPVECEHAATAIGDTVQQTTTGLAAYYSRTNTVTFTDGWRHWAITPNGFVTWEGTQGEPPVASGPGSG